MNSNARKAFRFKLHRALPDLKDDGIKKINMLIIPPSLIPLFDVCGGFIVERVNKMTVLSTDDDGPCAPPDASDHWNASARTLSFIIFISVLSKRHFIKSVFMSV